MLVISALADLLKQEAFLLLWVAVHIHVYMHILTYRHKGTHELKVLKQD